MSRLTALTRSARGWLLVCFATGAAAWALLLPLGAGADESAHTIYAAAVAGGAAPVHAGHGVAVGVQAAYPVSAAVADTASQDCTRRRPAQTAACLPPLTSATGTVRARTTAAGYPVPYYELIGRLATGRFDAAHWYLMRLLSVALCTALLALGLWPVRAAHAPGVAVGVLVAAAPTPLLVIGLVNPSGAEITAALSMVIAGGALAAATASRDGPRTRRGLISIAVLAGYLAVARPGSALEALGVLGLVGLLVAPAVVGAVRRAPRVAAPAALAAVTAVLAVVAVAYLAVGVVPSSPARSHPDGWRLVLNRYVRPHIADRVADTISGVTDTHARVPLWPWLVGLLLLVGAALVAGRWLERLALVGALAAALVIGPAVAIRNVFPGGAGYQARYAMPLFCLVAPLAAGIILHRRPRWFATPVASIVPLAWAVLLLSAMAATFARYATGLPAPATALGVAHAHTWLPPAWPLLFALLAAMLFSAWRLAVIAAVPSDPAPTPPPQAAAVMAEETR